MPSTLLSFTDTEIRMRYREPFLTEGLNAKLAINQPRGIYEGFRLGTNASALTITINAQPTALDHSAVYLTGAGLSLTLRKVGGNFFQSLSAYASKTVVLAIYATYVLGSETSAELRAYELFPTDEFSGAGERPELVVLGTVVVPAAGLIPAANITHDRRTMAWESVAPEATTWSPLLRNGSFETSETGATHARASRFWSAAVSPGAGGTIAPVTTDANTGLKSLQFTYASGAPTAVITQPVNVPVTPGQLLRAQVFVKAQQALTAGTISLALTWRDGTSAVVATSTIPIPVTGVDATYRKIESTIPVPTSPAGILTLAEIQIQLAGVSFGVAAAAVRFDDLQVYVESQSVTGQFLFYEKGRTYEVLQDLLFEDQAAWTQDAIALRFTNGTGLVGERKDQSASSAIQPVLDWRGRVQLGVNLGDTEAKALQPRVTAPVSTVGGVDFTLLWESTGTALAGIRLYASSLTGAFVYVTNAVWGGTTWTKDLAGQTATKVEIARDGLRLRTRVADSAWADAAWDPPTHLTNPLATAAEARVARLALTGFDGAAVTEFTQLLSLTFTGYVMRVYAGHLTNDVSLMVTFNAQWNGTNWVKDTSARTSARMTIAFTGATGAADPSRLHIEHQTCNTTDTFPEADWSVLPTTATLPNSGGDFYTGRVYAGPIRSSNPQARLSASPDGFGDGITAASFFVDYLGCIETPNFMVDLFGNLDSGGGMIFEEFWNTTVPVGWSNFVAGAGVVEYNYEGVSRVRLNPGAVDTAGIRTNATIVQAAYSSFNAEVRWPNVLGKTQIGYEDVAANIYMGFLQDSATYGDENIRVALRTGAGLQIFDSGVSLTPIVDDWVKLRAFARGGSGLLTVTSLFWSIDSKKGSASGVFTPGGSILSPTAGVYFRFNAQNGAFLVIERAAFGGHNNFAL